MKYYKYFDLMKKYINASYWLTDWLGSADQIHCVCMAVYDHD